MHYSLQSYDIRPNSRLQPEGNYNTIGISLLKKQLKIEATDVSEDDLLNAYLVSAIKNAEAYTRRVIDLSTWRTYLTSLSDVTLDVHPVTLSSIVIKYFDVNDAEQTLNTSLYTVQNNGDDFARIEFEGSLPSLSDIDEPVYIEYQAGYINYPEWLIVPVLKRAADEFEIRTGQVSHSLNTAEFNFHKSLFPYKML
jgi:hypothetical protein